MLRLGWQDRDKVYVALIAALHALRDWLPRDEAICIGACFPPLLRGLYYEGWHAAEHVVNRFVFSEATCFAVFDLLGARNRETVCSGSGVVLLRPIRRLSFRRQGLRRVRPLAARARGLPDPPIARRNPARRRTYRQH
jgi:Uncharacterized conserved protein (DUF2267)